MKNLYLPLLLVFFTFCNSPKKPEEKSSVEIVSILSPTGKNTSLPYLVHGDDNNLYLSWVEELDSNWVELKFSKLIDREWSEPELIASGNDWFVNWADYPMLAVDKDGNMMAHYLAKSDVGTYSYDVNIVTKKSGSSWSSATIPHDDGTPTEHGFVTMLPKNDGTFQVAWLDGRNTGNNGHDVEGHGNGAMTLRTAVISLDGELSEESELDNRVCDCCQTGGTMMNNKPFFVYRDRSETEVRDMSFVRLDEESWTSPKAISSDNWQISGCPVNGPKMTANEEVAAVAWFTSANNAPTIKVAFWDKSSEKFDDPIIIDQSSPMGRVDVVISGKDRAIVSWLDTEDDKAIIKCREVSKNGILGDEIRVTESSSLRGSGFPQMAKLGNSIYFASTSVRVTDDSKIISMYWQTLN